MPLTSLPNELLMCIVEDLSALDKLRLSRASKLFRILIGPPSRDEYFRRNRDKECGDPERLHRTCSRCTRLLRFYHFSAKQAGARVKPESRMCLSCHAEHQSDRNAVVVWLYGTKVRMCEECKQVVLQLEASPFEPLPPHGQDCGWERCLQCQRPSGPRNDCVCRHYNRDAAEELKNLLKQEEGRDNHVEFVVSRLIQRLDRCMDSNELRKLKKAGFEQFFLFEGRLGSLDPVGTYIRKLEAGKAIRFGKGGDPYCNSSGIGHYGRRIWDRGWRASWDDDYDVDDYFSYSP